MLPLNAEGLSEYLNRLLQRPRAVLALLVALFVLLLFLTSLLGEATTLPETLVDVAIYTIYLLFVLLLGSTVFILYYLFDSEASLSSRFESGSTGPLRTETPVAEKADRTRYQSISHAKSESAPLALLKEVKRAWVFEGAEKMKGLALVEAYPAEEMAAYLMRQHLQIAAVILVVIDPKKAAAILDCFKHSQNEEMRKRIVKGATVSSTALKVLDQALQKELAPLNREYSALRRLGSADIREILRHVDKKELIYALKGAPQELQERFFANMSSKASVEFKNIMASISMPDKIKRQNALRSVYLLAEQLRDNDKIHINNTGQR